MALNTGPLDGEFSNLTIVLKQFLVALTAWSLGLICSLLPYYLFSDLDIYILESVSLLKLFVLVYFELVKIMNNEHFPLEP